MTLTFGEPQSTGELAHVPAGTDVEDALVNGVPVHSPVGALVDVFWGGHLIGVIRRRDWREVTGDRAGTSFSSYEFESCSGRTTLAASSLQPLCEEIVKRLSTH